MVGTHDEFPEILPLLTNNSTAALPSGYLPRWLLCDPLFPRLRQLRCRQTMEETSVPKRKAERLVELIRSDVL